VSDNITAARQLLSTSHRVVILTGAGISTAAGIPDYRGPDGVWTKNPGAERRSHIDTWLTDPEARRAGWERRLNTDWAAMQPTAAHSALAAFAITGRLSLVVTQNIDGLHQRSGLDPELLIEIHGTVHDSICLRCDDRGPIEKVLERVRLGDTDPHCEQPDCNGLLKAATVSFGQSLNEADLYRAQTTTQHADLFIAIGSTLGVFPIAGLVPIAARANIPIIIVNGSPTEMDEYATLTIDTDINDAVPQIFAP
jgi:NAD-dependent deacetylase